MRILDNTNNAVETEVEGSGGNVATPSNSSLPKVSKFPVPSLLEEEYQLQRIASLGQNDSREDFYRQADERYNELKWQKAAQDTADYYAGGNSSISYLRYADPVNPNDAFLHDAATSALAGVAAEEFAKKERVVEEFLDWHAKNPDASEEEKFEADDKAFKEYFNMGVIHGSGFRHKDTARNKPFESEALYRVQLMRAFVDGTRAFNSERYQRMMELERVRSSITADEYRERAVKILGLRTVKFDMTQYAAPRVQFQSISAQGGFPGSSAVRQKTNEEIDEEIELHKKSLSRENLLELYNSVKGELGQRGRAIVEDSIMHGHLREEFVPDMIALFEQNPREAGIVQFMIDSSKPTEHAIWTSIARSFGGTIARYYTNAAAGTRRYIFDKLDAYGSFEKELFDAMRDYYDKGDDTIFAYLNDNDKARLDVLLARERTDDIPFLPMYYGGGFFGNYNDNKSRIPVAVKEFLSEVAKGKAVDLLNSDEALQARRIDLLTRQLVDSYKEWDRYDWWDKSMIGAAGSFGYATALWLLKPWGASLLFGALAHMEEVEERTLLEGGDPRKRSDLQKFITALAYTGVEKMQVKGGVKALTDIKRKVMWRHLFNRNYGRFLRSFLRNSPTMLKTFLYESWEQILEEGVQGGIEGVEVASGKKDPLSFIDETKYLAAAFGRGFAEDAVESAGSMALTTGLYMVGGGALGYAGRRRTALDVDSALEHILTGRSIHESVKDRIDKEKKRNGKDTKLDDAVSSSERFYEFIQKLWDDSKSAKEAIQKLRDMGFTRQEVFAIADHFDEKSFIIENALRLENPLEMQRDLAIAGGKFSIGKNTTYDVVNLFKLINPEIKVEEQDFSESYALEDQLYSLDQKLRALRAKAQSRTIDKRSKKKHVHALEAQIHALEKQRAELVSRINDIGKGKVVPKGEGGESVKKSYRITVPIINEDGTRSERRITLVEDLEAQDINSKGFARSVENATNGEVKADEFYNLDPMAKQELVARLGLGSTGWFRLLRDGADIARFNAEGLINLFRTPKAGARVGGNYALSHEFSHAMFEFGIDLGLIKKDDATVSVLRKLFGDPKVEGDLWDYESSANWLSDYMREKHDFAGWSPDERSLIEKGLGQLGGVFRWMAERLSKSMREKGKERRKKEARERLKSKNKARAIKEVYRAVSEGDFRGIGKYSAVDIGDVNQEKKEESKNQDGAKMPIGGGEPPEEPKQEEPPAPSREQTEQAPRPVAQVTQESQRTADTVAQEPVAQTTQEKPSVKQESPVAEKPKQVAKPKPKPKKQTRAKRKAEKQKAKPKRSIDEQRAHETVEAIDEAIDNATTGAHQASPLMHPAKHLQEQSYGGVTYTVGYRWMELEDILNRIVNKPFVGANAEELNQIRERFAERAELVNIMCELGIFQDDYFWNLNMQAEGELIPDTWLDVADAGNGNYFTIQGWDNVLRMAWLYRRNSYDHYLNFAKESAYKLRVDNTPPKGMRAPVLVREILECRSDADGKKLSFADLIKYNADNWYSVGALRGFRANHASSILSRLVQEGVFNVPPDGNLLAKQNIPFLKKFAEEIKMPATTEAELEQVAQVVKETVFASFIEGIGDRHLSWALRALLDTRSEFGVLTDTLMPTLVRNHKFLERTDSASSVVRLKQALRSAAMAYLAKASEACSIAKQVDIAFGNNQQLERLLYNAMKNGTLTEAFNRAVDAVAKNPELDEKAVFKVIAKAMRDKLAEDADAQSKIPAYVKPPKPKKEAQPKTESATDNRQPKTESDAEKPQTKQVDSVSAKEGERPGFDEHGHLIVYQSSRKEKQGATHKVLPHGIWDFLRPAYWNSKDSAPATPSHQDKRGRGLGVFKFQTKTPSPDKESPENRWGNIFPLYQGNKKAMSFIVKPVLEATMTESERASYDTLVDYFGGGGCWGLYLALTSFPNVKRLCVNEFDPDILEKIKVFHEHGGKLGEDIKALLTGEVFDITIKDPKGKAPDAHYRGTMYDVVRQLCTDGTQGGGSVIADRLEKVLQSIKEKLTPQQRGMIRALVDHASQKRGDQSSGKTGFDESFKVILASLNKEAVRIKEATNEFKKRGGTIEYRSGDAAAYDDAPRGSNVVAVCDPPYYRTSGYGKGNGVVPIDGAGQGWGYEQTRALVDKLIDYGDAVIYTDEAWWFQTSKANNELLNSGASEADFAKIVNSETFQREQSILKWFYDNLDHYDNTGHITQDRQEVLGVHHGAGKYTRPADPTVNSGPTGSTDDGAVRNQRLEDSADGLGVPGRDAGDAVRPVVGGAQEEDGQHRVDDSRDGQGSDAGAVALKQESASVQIEQKITEVIDEANGDKYNVVREPDYLPRVVRRTVRRVREDRIMDYARLVTDNAERWLAEKRQELDAQMKANGYTEKVWHGTNAPEFNTWRFAKREDATADADINMAFFSYDESTAENYAVLRTMDVESHDAVANGIETFNMRELYINPGRTLHLDETNSPTSYSEFTKIVKEAYDNGYDSIVVKGAVDDMGYRLSEDSADGFDILDTERDEVNGRKAVGDAGWATDILILFDRDGTGGRRIKAAEPITFQDEQGLLPIPTEMRANPESDNLLYNVTKQDDIGYESEFPDGSMDGITESDLATIAKDNKAIESLNSLQRTGVERPVLTEDDTLYAVTRRNKDTITRWLEKRYDLTDKDRALFWFYTKRLEPSEQLATAKWFCDGGIRLPDDMLLVKDSVTKARLMKEDPLRFNTPAEIQNEYRQRFADKVDADAEEDILSPDDPRFSKVLTNKVDYGNGITVYDVAESREGQNAVRELMNSHLGKKFNSWCLMTADANGVINGTGLKYWDEYKSIQKRVAFHNGRIIAFCANDTEQTNWRNLDDHSHGDLIPCPTAYDAIPGAVINTYYNEATGEMHSKPESDDEDVGTISRGSKRNGWYEEWYPDGVTMKQRTHFKKGETLSGETWYDNGSPDAIVRDGRTVARYDARGVLQILYSPALDYHIGRFVEEWIPVYRTLWRQDGIYDSTIRFNLDGSFRNLTIQNFSGDAIAEVNSNLDFYVGQEFVANLKTHVPLQHGKFSEVGRTENSKNGDAWFDFLGGRFKCMIKFNEDGDARQLSIFFNGTSCTLRYFPETKKLSFESPEFENGIPVDINATTVGTGIFYEQTKRNATGLLNALKEILSHLATNGDVDWGFASITQKLQHLSERKDTNNLLEGFIKDGKFVPPSISAELNEHAIRDESLYSVSSDTPGVGVNDSFAAYYTGLILSGKKVTLEDVKARMDKFHIRSLDPEYIYYTAIAKAKNLKEDLSADAIERIMQDPKAIKASIHRDTVKRTVNDVVKRTGKASNPELGRRIEQLQQKHLLRTVDAAKGFTAERMLSELPISLVDALFAVGAYERTPAEKARLEALRKKRAEDKAKQIEKATNEAETESDLIDAIVGDENYRDPTDEERSYFDSLMERARDAQAKSEEEKKTRKRNKKNAEASAETEQNVDGSAKEEANESAYEEFGFSFDKVKRIAPVFEDEHLFARFLVEWTMDNIINKYPNLANRADLWSDPVAMKELLETAGHILRHLAQESIGSVRKNPVRLAIDTKILSMLSERSQTFAGALSDISKIYKLIHNSAIKIRKKTLIDNLVTEVKRLAGIKGPFSGIKEKRLRTVDGRVELWCRWVIKYVNMSDAKLEQEERRLLGIINTFDNDESLSFSEKQTSQYNSAREELMVLQAYGGMKNWSHGQIADACADILEQVSGRRKEFEERRDQIDEANNLIIDMLVSAIEAGQSSGYKSGDSTADRLERAIYSMNGNLTLEMQSLIRFCKDAELRKDALIAIEDVATMISKGTQTYRVALVETQEQIHEILKTAYGNAESGIRHLQNERVPVEIAKKIFKQSDYTAPTYGQLLQLYASTIQSDYQKNAEKHGRLEMLSLMEDALTPEDRMFHSMIVSWYAQNRESLSKAVSDISGIGIATPNNLYCPVRVLRSKEGFASDAISWAPIPSVLNRRVPHSLDFDESVNFLDVVLEQQDVRAKTIGYGAVGIRLRTIFTSKRLQDAVRKHADIRDLNTVNDHLKDVLVQEVERNDHVKWLKPFNVARAWVSRFLISWNISSAAKQLGSMPVFANANLGGEVVGLKRVWEYFTSIRTDEARQAIKDLMESDGYKARYKMGWSEEVQNLLQNPSKQRWIRYIERAYDKGMEVNKAVDAVACLWIGQGFYRDALEMLQRRGQSFEEAKQNALALTWSVIENGQQSGRVENLNRAQRRGGLIIRSLFHLKTALLLQNNYVLQGIREVRSGTPGAKGRLARALFINSVIIPTILTAITSIWRAIMGDEPPEDEESIPQFIKEFVWNMIDGVSAPLFFTSAIIHASYDELFGKTGYDSSQLPAMSVSVKLSKHTARLLKDTVKMISPMDVADELTWDKVRDDLLNILDDVSAPARHVRRAYNNYTTSEEDLY